MCSLLMDSVVTDSNLVGEVVWSEINHRVIQMHLVFWRNVMRWVDYSMRCVLAHRAWDLGWWGVELTYNEEGVLLGNFERNSEEVPRSCLFARLKQHITSCQFSTAKAPAVDLVMLNTWRGTKTAF